MKGSPTRPAFSAREIRALEILNAPGACIYESEGREYFILDGVKQPVKIARAIVLRLLDSNLITHDDHDRAIFRRTTVAVAEVGITLPAATYDQICGELAIMASGLEPDHAGRLLPRSVLIERARDLLRLLQEHARTRSI